MDVYWYLDFILCVILLKARFNMVFHLIMYSNLICLELSERFLLRWSVCRYGCIIIKDVYIYREICDFTYIHIHNIYTYTKRQGEYRKRYITVLRLLTFDVSLIE